MSAQVDRFTEASVDGYLHTPEQKPFAGLVLTHGAGGNCQSPQLIALAEAFVSLNIAVLRCDLPFRQRKRGGPPYPAQAAADREGLRSAVESLRNIVKGDIFLGGHSYGGRQASMLASEQPDLASGLLLLSYPLHAPGKPQQLRTGHFEALQTATLFVHGTKDPFGSIQEMELALPLIPAKKMLRQIDGAGHDLNRGKIPAVEVAMTFLDLVKTASPAVLTNSQTT